MTALKSVPGNGLAWLERHDREWLTIHAPNFLELRHVIADAALTAES